MRKTDAPSGQGGRRSTPEVYCAAAAIRVSRKAGITSFAKRSKSSS